MLKLSAQAVIVEPDGRSVPDPLLVGGKWGDLTGTIGHDGPFRRGSRPLDAVHSEPTGLFFPRKRASWPAIWAMSDKNRGGLARERS